MSVLLETSICFNLPQEVTLISLYRMSLQVMGKFGVSGLQEKVMLSYESGTGAFSYFNTCPAAFTKTSLLEGDL